MIQNMDENTLKSNVEHNMKPLPTERFYHLKCWVEINRVPYLDIQGKNKIAPVYSHEEAEMVFLIPLESTQRDLFYMAWLPDDDNEHSEVVSWIGNPVWDYCRMAVKRANRECREPHLKMMTLKGEENLKILKRKLKGFWRRKLVEVRILPEHGDQMADGADQPGNENTILKRNL